jgi:hypothetical protein
MLPGRRHSGIPRPYRLFRGPETPDYTVAVIRPYRIEVWTSPAMEPEVLEIGWTKASV